MTPADWTITIAIGNFLFLLMAIIGGYITLRSSITKTSAVVQDRVREALKAENELLQSRVVRLEKDVVEAKAESGRLSDLITLIIETLEKLGIILKIDGDVVQVKDATGSLFTVRQRQKKAASNIPQPP